MRLFFELSIRAFRRQISYRAATLAGLATNYFWGMLRAILMIALYDQQQEVAGYTLQAAITYTGLTQAVIGFLSAFSWYDLMNSVYTGEVASHLLKPMNFFSYWLAQDLGRAIAALLTRGLPIIIGYEIFFDLTYPQGSQWALLLLVLILSWLVSFSWRFIVNLPAFWFQNATGIGRFAFMSSLFLSGFLMPLRFFPDWVVNIAKLTPFPHTVNTLIEIYLGILTGAAAWQAFAEQVLWIISLFLLGQLILRAGIRKLVILGG